MKAGVQYAVKVKAVNLLGEGNYTAYTGLGDGDGYTLSAPA